MTIGTRGRSLVPSITSSSRASRTTVQRPHVHVEIDAEPKLQPTPSAVASIQRQASHMAASMSGGIGDAFGRMALTSGAAFLALARLAFAAGGTSISPGDRWARQRNVSHEVVTVDVRRGMP